MRDYFLRGKRRNQMVLFSIQTGQILLDYVKKRFFIQSLILMYKKMTNVSGVKTSNSS